MCSLGAWKWNCCSSYLRAADVAKPPGEALPESYARCCDAERLGPPRHGWRLDLGPDTAGQVNRRLLAADGASTERPVRAPILRIGIAPCAPSARATPTAAAHAGQAARPAKNCLRESAIMTPF